MEQTTEVYVTARPRSTPDFERVGDIIENLLEEMFAEGERRAGDMRGEVRPEQRTASRYLDLLAEIEGTE